MPQRGSVRLKEEIRRAALDLGFAQVGFAPAERPPYAAAYLEWLDRGWHGEMAYMAREDAVRRRLSPADALEGCRTLIVVSLQYGPDGPHPSETHPESAPASDDLNAPADPGAPAVLARYARGRDYHNVFEERLARLEEAIAKLEPDAVFKPYVDYGPVLEREHAQRAGLGWIGKNTMLIHPRRGSYLLLGELLTTLELPPDDPFAADHCGTCERCIEACPTGAIQGSRLLDARLCISYLTIELKGAIPVELRAPIGNRVFGCDICQEVCPWNSDAPAGPEPAPVESAVRLAPDDSAVGSALSLEPGRPAPPETMVVWACEIAALTALEFKERYRGTAFARPGRDGMLRNLAVGLGNAGGPGARPVLKRLAGDASVLVREHAEWGLERLNES
jgi:epoxyqueuosine reductase